jgi:hypothetical protein
MPTGVVRQKKRTMVTMDPALNLACALEQNTFLVHTASVNIIFCKQIIPTDTVGIMLKGNLQENNARKFPR